MADVDIDKLKKVVAKLRSDKDQIERKRANFNKISFRIIRKRDQQHFYFVEWVGRHRWEGAIFSRNEILDREANDELMEVIGKEMRQFGNTFKRSDNRVEYSKVRYCLYKYISHNYKIKATNDCNFDIYEPMGMVFEGGYKSDYTVGGKEGELSPPRREQKRHKRPKYHQNIGYK